MVIKPNPILPLLALFGTLYFVQGLVEPTACLPAQPLQSQLRGLNFSTHQIGRFFGVIGIAWSLKPLLGLLSDLVPISGRRRLPYLLLGTALTPAAFLAIALSSPASTGKAPGLFGWFVDATSTQPNIAPLGWLLLLSGLGIALTDVVIDAVAVETGQPLGITGQIQSIQWAALAIAGLLVGVTGGFIAEHKLLRPMFAACSLLCLVSLAVVLAVLHEPRRNFSPADNLQAAARQVWSRQKLTTLAAAAAFLFLWNFNPFSSNVLQEYSTQVLGYSELNYGLLLSLQNLGMLAGCLIYFVICRRVPFGWLIHVSILAGCLSTLAYWLLRDWPTAVLANLIFGLSWQIGLLVQLDLAARICPPAAAGTLFATLMAVTNTANTAGMYLGGGWYAGLTDYYSGNAHSAFDSLVGIAALFTAACWLLVPLLIPSASGTEASPVTSR